MFRSMDDQREYITVNFPEVTDQRMNDDHWDLLCTRCKVVRGFQLIKREVAGHSRPAHRQWVEDFSAPKTYYFRCPVCAMYKIWVVFEIRVPDADGDLGPTRYFRVTSIPSEGMEEIEELPEQPAALRTAYRQAIRSMDANAHLAAAAMFRRALQIITRDLIGATPGNLANELREIVGKTYNGAIITTDFSANGYIVKEAGNQGAHPDQDPDLLDFSPEDAADLQDIFMQLVSDLFIAPEAVKKAKAEFLGRRKILPQA